MGWLQIFARKDLASTIGLPIPRYCMFNPHLLSLKWNTSWTSSLNFQFFFGTTTIHSPFNHHCIPLTPIQSTYGILITSSSHLHQIPWNPKKSLKIHPCLPVPVSKSTYRTAEVFASSSLAEQQTPRAQLIRDTVSKASGAGEEQPILIWGWINTY